MTRKIGREVIIQVFLQHSLRWATAVKTRRAMKAWKIVLDVNGGSSDEGHDSAEIVTLGLELRPGIELRCHLLEISVTKESEGYISGIQ